MLAQRARHVRTLFSMAPMRSVVVNARSVVVARQMSTRITAEDEAQHKANMQKVVKTLTQQNNEIAEKIVPWFIANMPASYFRQVNEITRMDHLKALAALRGIKQNLSLTLNSKLSDDVTEVTFIRPVSEDTSLISMLAGMPPADGTLSNVKVYNAADNTLALNIFSFGKPSAARATLEDGAHITQYIQELKAGKHASDPKAPVYDEKIMNREALREYLARCQPSYVTSSHPRRFLIQRALFEKVKGTERVAVHHEKHGADLETPSGYWVTIAAANVLPKLALHKTAYLLHARGLKMERVHLDVVQDAANGTNSWPGSVTMLRALVNPGQQASAFVNPESAEWAQLNKDLARLKWLSDATMEFGLVQHPFLGLDRAEIITAYASMLHGPLSKINAYAFSRQNIFSVVRNKRNVNFAAQMADLFVDRFNPKQPLSDNEFARRVAAIRTATATVADGTSRVVLEKMLEAIESTLRTNFFMPDRYALSMRLKPEIMITPDKVKPYGVFFVHGRRFNGFHVRFRDIARGGLRVVSPNSDEQFAIESARQFDEAYNLSYAQQLKNKDIPEGGSKAVILVDVNSVNPASRFYAVRKSVRAFTDSILDLIVNTPETQANVVDYLGKQEILYLGPDEQIIPEDINWIVAQAKKRGYSIPSAFMSSKPDAGINHKTYGVTSEGAAVYLRVALLNQGIDPTKQPFTVKITGGPDGDVAGNMMRILIRDYGSNARIVAVADGFGCAEDPKGLNHQELLRLFQEAKPISEFSRNKLNSGGQLYTVDNEEGVRMRNTMHFRVQADAFVPGGGRPHTIDGENWKQFLRPDGTPSSPLIVEGANLFLTSEARAKLFEAAGVRIVKDSSANKCGVITSSYEICSSMLLSHDEFMAIKEELVADVLRKLRELAQMEAELLFREFANYPGALPHFSERISNAINKAKDALGDRLANLQVGEPLYHELMPLFHEHLPKKLVEVAANRIDSRIPIQYIRNAFAAALASKMVYREGVHFIESQPADKLADRALSYHREERRLRRLLDDLKASSLPQQQKDLVCDLIRRGGVRTALGIY